MGPSASARSGMTGLVRERELNDREHEMRSWVLREPPRSLRQPGLCGLPWLAPGGVETEVFDSLGALPFFDGTWRSPATRGHRGLRRAIAGADALLVVTPEYNGGMSGVLKNALDWASRGPVRLLAGKPVAVMGASPGGTGPRAGSTRSLTPCAARARTCSITWSRSPSRRTPSTRTSAWSTLRPRSGRGSHGRARRPGPHLGRARGLTARGATGPTYPDGSDGSPVR